MIYRFWDMQNYVFFIICKHMKMSDMQYAHKIVRKNPCQIWQNVIILLSFYYHLAD